MLAFSNDYYGFIFRATQSVELFCAYLLKPTEIKPKDILSSFIGDTRNHLQFFVYTTNSKNDMVNLEIMTVH